MMAKKPEPPQRAHPEYIRAFRVAADIVEKYRRERMLDPASSDDLAALRDGFSLAALELSVGQ